MVRIADVAKYDGKEIELGGWVHHKTGKGKLYFVQVRDGSGIIQCVVYKNDVDESTFQAAQELTQESSLKLKGRVHADERAPGGFEIQTTSITTLQIAVEFPITPKDHGTTFLMDHRHLWLRSRRQHAILRVRHEIIRACRDYFDSNGFILLDTPILTPAACEGTTTLFETGYFGQKAFLSQSGQLYNEACAMAHGKVYCFGPTFRAEKSKTRRHLTEFWMIEPEIAFCDLDGNMDLAEDFVCAIVSRILENRQEELKIIERNTEPLEKVQKPFQRISYTVAVKILHEEGIDFENGNDFGATDETILADRFDRPFFVHRFPAAIKAFYMKKDSKNPEFALGCDLLAPEGYGEIIGGGQREDDLSVLETRLKEHDLSREAFEWYLDLRRYGSVPHAGFGMGIERVVAWICGLQHVRETIPFPRMTHRLTP